MSSFCGITDLEFVEAVNALKSGDMSSFDVIYSSTIYRLKKYALYLSKDPCDADDLTQETYLRILENINGMRENKAFMMWAKRIMYNLFVERYRKGLREFACEDTALYAIQDSRDMADDPEEVLLREEISSSVDQAVDELPDKQKDAVKQFYYGYKSVRWIAEKRDTTENTIKTRLFYARKSLKNALAL